LAEGIRTHKAHYRLAVLSGADDGTAPIALEDAIRGALTGPLGLDCYERAFKISDDRADKAMINNSDTAPPGVFLEIFHLDARRNLPFVKKPASKSPTATVHSRLVPDDEDAMGLPAFLLVVGNHVASIEPFNLRVGALQSYLNALLQAAGSLGPDGHWKLVPRVEAVTSAALLKRGVTRLEIKPLARLVGDAPTEVADTEVTRRRPTKAAEERTARGGKVVQLLELLGASSADLAELRSSMSTDLGLEAKVEIFVKRVNRSTAATLESDDISQAIESLERDNSVFIVSPDGNTRGRLSTLWEPVEIADEAGEMKLSRVSQALVAALHKWSAKGIIDLSGHMP
jgi:hypothetical protein